MLNQVLRAQFTQFLVLAFFVLAVGQLTKAIVLEKELKIREGLQMMGLQGGVYWLHWWLTYFVTYFIMTLALTLVCCVTPNALFAESDVTLVFILWLVFLIGLLQYSCLTSVFFAQSSVGSTFSMVAYLTLFFPTLATASFTSSSQQLALALVAPSGFAMAFSVIAEAESSGVGLTWNSMWHTGADAADASFGALLCMLVLDIFLYAILAWYFDKVIPQEQGVPLKPWFFLLPAYWFPNNNAAEAVELQHTTASEDIEPCQQAVGASGVQMRNLGKVFDTPDGPKVAVSSLSLEFCEGQITVFLGHNGAGKSTTISMLIGVLPCSSGDATVAGHSIATDLEKVRGSLGVCPQHDVLFLHLTVEEHLWLFAKLKGVPANLVAQQIDTMIKYVDLEPKRHVQAFALSGGMKRKLSVGIALIGGSQTVFLDEPSSGMDPAARRHLWDLLRDSRTGRTIVLTTHFMDEAEVLGDRIAILSQGKLRCCGSSLFLKQRFGVGYCLTLVSEQSGGATALQNQIQHHIEDILTGQEIRLLSSAGAELVLQIPLEANPQLVKLFSMFEERQIEYGIRTYGLSLTSMESVFLKIADVPKEEVPAVLLVPVDDCKQSEVSLDVQSSSKTTRRVSCFQRSGAILYKKMHYCKRDFRSFCLGTMIPVLAVVVGLVFYVLFTDLDQPSLSMSACQLSDSIELLQAGDAKVKNFQLQNCVVSPALQSAQLVPDTATFDSCMSNVSEPPGISGGIDLGGIESAFFGSLFGTIDSQDSLRQHCNSSTVRAVDSMDNTIVGALNNERKDK